MVLCHRAVGSMRQNILERDSEAAFKSLAGFFSLARNGVSFSFSTFRWAVLLTIFGFGKKRRKKIKVTSATPPPSKS